VNTDSDHSGSERALVQMSGVKLAGFEGILMIVLAVVPFAGKFALLGGVILNRFGLFCF